MAARSGPRPTVGVIVTWPVYFGTSILWYQRTLLQGMHQAAASHGCNLLMACGMDAIPSPRSQVPAWPALSSDSTFVPVGPWNTDGLIVAGMFLSPEQEAYLGGLAAAGHPLVYAGFDGPGLSVNIDSAGGVRQALEHLCDHGHRRIAFIAGFDSAVGESGPRLRAYLELSRAMGLEADPRLIAYSELVAAGGRRAMREILASGAPFTAVLASNDAAAFGAAEVLRERGLRVPEDVALVGFDDLLESRDHVPPLTTLHNPAFNVGRRAVRTMLDLLAGRPPAADRVRIPVRLVVRRSCGCGPGLLQAAAAAPAADLREAVARAMVAAMAREARARPEELTALCRELISGLLASVCSGDAAAFEDALLELLQRAELLDEDVQAWGAALAALEAGLPELLPPSPAAARAVAAGLIAWARQVVAEQLGLQAGRLLRRVENLADGLGMVTTQLLLTLDARQIEAILAAHLPQLNLPHLLAALYVPAEGDPVALAEPLLSHGLAGAAGGGPLITRQFPPPDLYPPDRPFQLALLPLAAQGLGAGFVVIDAANLEPGAVIVRSLATALRGGRLYAEALHGRAEAEKADRLKTMLLTNVSHELRTPLNIILGYAQAALVRAEGGAAPDAELAQDVRQIARSGGHLLRLINDLLDLSRAEVDELRLLPEPLDARRLLEEVFQSSSSSFGAGGAVAWRLALAPALPPLTADPVRLRQILLNLLHNAHKFTRRGQITLGAEPDEAGLHIWVADTGGGIPEELQQQIFDPFVSAGGHGLPVAGIGVGLTITRRLVALHGGRISVDSQVDRGSTFHVYLPAPALPVAAAPPAAGERRLLVVISAAPRPAADLLALAERRGLALRQLRPDEDVAGLLAAAPPALVVWDLATVGPDGWRVAGQLRDNPRLGQTPIMLYHSSAESPSEQGGLATGLLLKPVGDAALLEAVGGLAPGEARGSILIVEDDAQTRALHHRLIAARFPAYGIREAENGRAALDLLAHETPSMVVLDLTMPEVDGFAVLEAMRADPRTSAVPVLVLSGRLLSPDDMRRLVAVRVIFQTKEILTESGLAETMRRTLAREHALPPPTSALVKKALAFIHQHYHEPLSRQEIADALGVSKGYLGQIFSQELGLSPWDYIIRFRVVRAKELLRTTDEGVAEIAARVGFETAAYFSRIFHREVGCSPRTFRARPERGPGS